MEEYILDGEGEVEYAGFGPRLLAAIVDFLIFIPITVLIYYNMAKLKSLPLQVSLIVISALYKPLLEAIYGATWGKMALKIKVLTKDMAKIDWFQAIIRYIPWLIGNLISLFSAAMLFADGTFLEDKTWLAMQRQNEIMPQWVGLISLGVLLIVGLSILFNVKKRGIHDLMAGTVCIKTEPNFQ